MDFTVGVIFHACILRTEILRAIGVAEIWVSISEKLQFMLRNKKREEKMPVAKGPDPRLN